MILDKNKKGVYKITFSDGCFYIGSAWNENGIESRRKEHLNGRKTSPDYLQEKSREFGGWFIDGEQNPSVLFEVLKISSNQHRCLLWEQAYINKNIDNPLMLNKNRRLFELPDIKGKNNPFFGKRHSDKTLNKISKISLEEADVVRKRYLEEPVNSSMLAEEYGVGRGTICNILKYNTHVKEEDRNKELKPIKKPKMFSPKGKKALSEAHIGVQAKEKHPLWGKKRSEETIEKIRKASTGRKHSKESIEKRSKKMMGHEVSLETREKIGLAHRGKYGILTEEIVREIKMLWNTEYYRQKDLAKMYGVARGTINNIVHGYNWKWVK